MSSDNKKVFTTQASSKGAGADVTSEVVSLPDNVSDAILSVKTDASCTGVVDVELEMSPDGSNWCPAVTRTISATSSSQAEVIGNEEYVKLTPDAGEFKNKHARGVLNFDVNGAVVTPDGSGARDLMDQHIAVNKSFNYSQWFKTSEAPTNTYKPVLFRHGGYDDFENTQAVDLTDTATQNLCQDVSFSNTKISSGNVADTNYQLYFGDPYKSWTYCTWFTPYRLDANGNLVANTNNLAMYYSNATGNSRFVMTCQSYIGGNYSRPQVVLGYYSLSVSAGAAPAYNYTVNAYPYGTNNAGNQAATELESYFIALVSDHDTQTGSTTLNLKMYRSDGTSIRNQFWTFTPTEILPTNNNIFDGVDESLLYSRALTQAEIEAHFTNHPTVKVVDSAGNPTTTPAISPVDPSSLSTYSDAILHVRGGDADGDSTTTMNNLAPTNSFYPASFTGTFTIDELAPRGSYLPANNSQNLFIASSNLSISGWFKTTDTGTLFSNTGGAVATGLKVDVSGSAITASYLGSSLSTSVSGTFNDGNWHHIVMVLSPGSQLMIVDNLTAGTSSHTLVTDDLKGDNGFTLIGDGQNNANAASPAATDSSKLQASLSNWSIHSEALDQYAISQLYSNGHVRNINNLPSVNPVNIEAWYQLNDATNPQNDLSGNNKHLQYQDGNSPTETLVDQLVNATGATLVENTINGNAMTLSLTKNFNFTTNTWVATADQDTALCLSFNGFEEQAEHFALWKCAQTVGGQAIDICDGEWHNIILSYRGNNDLAGNNVAEGDTVKFGPGPAQTLAHNWMMSYDGEPLKSINDGSGVDYLDGLAATVTDTYNSTTYNVGFAIYNRHLKYETSNTEEVYKPHAQFSAGIHEAAGVDNINAFQGSVDETSFHSDCWWVDQAGTSIITNTFNQEKPATIYGSTTALSNRGANTGYPVGVPYPLLDPSSIGSGPGGNQYINPDRYDASTNPNGGLEGWWRWGDTPGDCSVTINDVRDHNDSINARDISAFEIVTADRQDMSLASESIYNANISASSSASATVTFPQIIVAGIQAGICNLKQISSPLLKYLRVKFTGAGSCDLGSSSTQAQINFRSKE